MLIDRRSFLGSLAATGTVAAASSWAEMPPYASVTLTMQSDTRKNIVPIDFMGLSYETAQLAVPGFFSASNQSLVSYVKTLGSSGVLRIGGNTSRFGSWMPSNQAQPAKPPDDQVTPSGENEARKFVLTPKGIDDLQGFLQATNWKLLYGVNLAGGIKDAAVARPLMYTMSLGSGWSASR